MTAILNISSIESYSFEKVVETTPLFVKDLIVFQGANDVNVTNIQLYDAGYMYAVIT